ncbi:MAG: carboxylating nicotinate-nucleotide diphosphorylase [Acidobacteria bacterium]|nr:carboxylating nicotinate-nucleotide diphosphorylase [Acidobacteriota bacterium]
MSWGHPEIREAILRALAEDIGSGDATTEACIPDDAQAAGFFLTREPLVLAGTPLLPLIYTEEQLEILHTDGTALDEDVVFARVSGSARRLLAFERTALNFIQRTSGIATQARKFADAVAGTGCTVLDTRKTTPGLRRVEKLAVKAGGCENHRTGLFDAILIKNNHITAAGGVAEALQRCDGSGLSIEIEVRTFEELDAALAAGAKRLLLDNFTPERAREAVKRVAGRAKTEISGNITLQNVREYAETGADYLSSGALTHSVRAMDISFRIEPLRSE